MKTAIHMIASAVALVTISGTAALAQDKAATVDHRAEKVKADYTGCIRASGEEFETIRAKRVAFTDAEVTVQTINDPEKLAALTAMVNDPETIRVMSNCATEPVIWKTWIRNGTDTNTMPSAMAKAIGAARMKPEAYNTWSVAVTDPTFHEATTSMAEAKWYEERAKWLVDSQTDARFLALMSGFVPTPPAAKPATPTN